MRFGHRRKVFPRGWRGVSGHFFHFFFGHAQVGLPVFFQGVLDIFGQLFFLQGVGWTRTLRGPLGPWGPRGVGGMGEASKFSVSRHA